MNAYNLIDKNTNQAVLSKENLGYIVYFLKKHHNISIFIRAAALEFSYITLYQKKYGNNIASKIVTEITSIIADNEDVLVGCIILEVPLPNNTVGYKIVRNSEQNMLEILNYAISLRDLNYAIEKETAELQDIEE